MRNKICLRQLRSIRRMLTTVTIITLVNTLVVSWIDYCNSVLAGVHEVHLQQLQRVLNAAARLIVRIWKYDSISATIRENSATCRVVDFKLCVTVFNSLHNLVSNYLSTIMSTGRREPQPSAPMLSCRWWPCHSSNTHNPLRSSQLCRRRTVHVELAAGISLQLSSAIRFPAWTENWTVCQSIFLLTHS